MLISVKLDKSQFASEIEIANFDVLNTKKTMKSVDYLYFERLNTLHT